MSNQLSIDDDNAQSIHHFLTHLTPALNRQFWQLISLKKIDDPDYAITSLQKAISICISLDTSNRTVNANNNGSTQSDAKGSSKLHCKYHPNSSSHSTADCRSKPPHDKSKPAKEKSSTPTPTPTQSQTQTPKDKSHIVCRACGQAGHYPTEAICPKRQLQPQLSAPYSNTPTWKSNTIATSTAAGTQQTNRQQQHNPAQTNARPSPTVRSVEMEFEADDHEQERKYSDRDSIGCSVVAFDRTPPESIFVPKKQNIIFLVNGIAFSTLLDTGATISFIDEELCKELQLQVESKAGTIKLAHAGVRSN